MLTTIRNVIRTPELRSKILFTIAMLAIYRLGVQIPAPGLDLDSVELLRTQLEEQPGGAFSYLNLLTGGGLATLSLFALGILPYITASIIIQVLTVAVPKLEEWQSQGAVGQRKITQWTRYASIVLALIQSSSLVFLVARNPEGLFGVDVGLFQDDSTPRLLLAVLCLTVGTAIVMWMGELMTQRGIGNGMSLLIFASVVSQLPAIGIRIQTIRGWLVLGLSFIVLLLLIAAIIFVEQGQRRIPVHFAKRVVGRKMMGGNNTYIPLKVNQAGVIPVIFASSMLQLPSLLANVLPSSPNNDSWGDDIRGFLDRNLFSPANLGYVIFFGLLIVGFTYFYNAIAFDPVRQADQLRKSGGFIPGIRPGPQTERHLAKILNRITLPGSLFLAAVALIPSYALARFVSTSTNDASFVAFSGISILIAVGVGLETMKQIDSQLTMRNYEGFLK